MVRLKNHFWSWFIFGLLVLSAKFAHADAGVPPTFEKIEVPAGHIFVPPQGYDDNDNIQFVLDGILPNGCYRVANEEVNVDSARKRIEVRLFAFRRTDGPCVDRTHLPVSLLAVVPYTLEVSAGRLAAGSWRISYPRPNLADAIRPFVIEKAKVVSIDEMPYAATSSIWIPDTVRGDLPVTAELIGSLTSTCSFLQQNVSIKLIDDVFIVRQGVGFKTDVVCATAKQSFQRTIPLGTVGEGRYLIHVRSMNGRSVNRVFSVVIPDPS